MPLLRIEDSFSSNRLVIYPLSPRAHYASDLSIERSALEKHLNSLGLHKDTDYQHSADRTCYALEFIGASRVIRALWTIPETDIQFVHPNMYRDPSSVEATQIKWHNQKRLFLTTSISSKECCHSEIKFVRKAAEEIFTYIKNEVDKIHSNYKSTITQQLAKDLADIAAMPDEDLLDGKRPRKYMLALASLFVAHRDELEQKTVFKPYTLFKGDSILAPLYNAVLNDHHSGVMNCVYDYKSRTSEGFAKKLSDELSLLYTKHVATNNTVAAITHTASRR